MNNLKKYLENEISDKKKKLAKVRNQNTRHQLEKEIKELEEKMACIGKHFWKAA